MSMGPIVSLSTTLPKVTATGRATGAAKAVKAMEKERIAMIVPLNMMNNILKGCRY
jgi:hypothetical protein